MKKLLLFMLATMVAIAAGAVEVFESGSLEYEIDTSTRVTVRGLASSSSNNTSVTIPSAVTYNGTKYRVYTIRENAFLDKTKLTTVTINWGVSEIKKGAFQGCTGLTTVKLPGSLTLIGENAFAGCTALNVVNFTGFSPVSAYSSSFPSNSNMKLYVPSFHVTPQANFRLSSPWTKFASVERKGIWDCYDGSSNYVVGYPDTYGADIVRNAYLSSIDDDATNITLKNQFTSNDLKFNTYGILPSACLGHPNLTSINTANCTYLNLIGKEAFYNCSKLTSANILCMTIDEGAFSRSGLTSITLNEGIQTIRDNAFSYTSLTTLNLPASVTNLQNYYFVDYLTTLTDITVASGNTKFSSYNGALTSKDRRILYRVPEGKTSYSINDNTETINDYAFYHCAITGFRGYYGLKTIKDHAFDNCTQLTTVRIPSSVTSLGTYVFRNCVKLDEVLINMNSAPSINADNMFSGRTRSYVTLYVPYSMENAYKTNGWTDFKDYNPSHMVAFDLLLSGSTASGAEGSSGYYTVTSTSSITHLGDTYDGRVMLVNHGVKTDDTFIVADYVTWNGKRYMVDKIGEFACYNWTNMTKIKLPPHLRYIGYEAFWKSGLTGTLALPYGLSAINNYAFEETKLTRLIVPSSVTNIYGSAFYRMTYLDDLVLNGGTSTLINASNTFNLTDVPTNCRILVPMGYVEQFKNHDSWKSRSAYIKAGAYDYIWSSSPYPFSYYEAAKYHITITSTSKVTYNGNTYDGKAKYVYHPNISSAEDFTASSGETDNTTDGGKRYLITEFGDSCFYFSNVTNVFIPASVQTIGKYCFYGSKLNSAVTIPTTVTSIGKSAYMGCSSLPSLRFGDVVPPFSEQIFANNPASFECIVPLTRFSSYYNIIKNWVRNGGAKDPYQQLAAWFKPVNTTRTLGLPIAVSFTKSNISEAYIASAYNKNQSEVTLQAVNQVPANTGVLMAGLSLNTEYIIHQPDGSVSAPSSNYLVATGASAVNLANVNVGYIWNAAQNSFNKATNSVSAGLAYLKLTSTQAGNNTVVYTDIFGRPGTPGDVNGDGAVTGDDLNMLINILLNKITANDPSVKGNPNVNGEGGVDGNDLNALINILLGK